jgi:hypothetical protein
MSAQTEIALPVLDSPFCTQCATRMFLVRIFPDRPGYDTRTYECPRCERVGLFFKQDYLSDQL